MTATQPNTETAALYWPLLKQGEASALESLYKLYANALYNYGSKFSVDQDLIKECIQEVFVAIWTRRAQLGNPQNVKNYLFKAFRLSVFKKANLLQKQVSYEETEHYPFRASLNIEEEMITAENNAALKERLEITLNKLSARQREVIFLKFYEAQSYEEIAEIMNISQKGAYKVMGRAIDALRDLLSKEDFFLILMLFSIKTDHFS